MLPRSPYQRCHFCFTSLFWLTEHLWERQFIVFVQNRSNPFAQHIWALENMKGSEDILWDLTWSKTDYKFIIHLGDFADFLSSLSGLWTACNFIVNVRLMLDECFNQNLCCLGSIYLTHWDVFILCFMVYITNYGIYIPFPDRLTIYPLNWTQQLFWGKVPSTRGNWKRSSKGRTTLHWRLLFTSLDLGYEPHQK